MADFGALYKWKYEKGDVHWMALFDEKDDYRMRNLARGITLSDISEPYEVGRVDLWDAQEPDTERLDEVR